MSELNNANCGVGDQCGMDVDAPGPNENGPFSMNPLTMSEVSLTKIFNCGLLIIIMSKS